MNSVRPADSNEYALLVAGWPDMAAFVESHKLGG
jgi:hypothetical protein